jgi:hypothetical protein
MQVLTRKDVEEFSKHLLNIEKPPSVLWSSIRIDGNCFFHAIDYAYTGKLLPRDSNKVIELRQNIVSTMTSGIRRNNISGVTYEEFMNARKNGVKIPWPYAETDVVVAAAKFYKRTIIVVSMNRFGGVTMIRPENTHDPNPLFLICENTVHYVPFHSKGVKITSRMRKRLKEIEKMKKLNGAYEHENGVYITTFLLTELTEFGTNVRNSVSVAKQRMETKKKMETKGNAGTTRGNKRKFVNRSRNRSRSVSAKSKKYKSNRSKSEKGNSNSLFARQLQTEYNDEKRQQNENAELARRMQQINANYEMAKQLQRQM